MPFGLDADWWVQALLATLLGLIGGALLQYWVPIVQWVRYGTGKVFHRPLDAEGVLVFAPPENGSSQVRHGYEAVRARFPDAKLNALTDDKAVFSRGIYGFVVQHFDGSAVHVVVTPHGLTSARADEFVQCVNDVIQSLHQAGTIGDFTQGSVSVQLPHRPERISVGPNSGLRIVDYTIGLRRHNVTCDIQLRPQGRYELSSRNQQHLLDVIRRIR